jgi:hypothetical protein
MKKMFWSLLILPAFCLANTGEITSADGFTWLDKKELYEFREGPGNGSHGK